MGFNTTVLVLNDSLDAIRDDPDFGRRLASAIMYLSAAQKPVDVPAHGRSGIHCNAATVVETHHADSLCVVLMGGNYGQSLGIVGEYRFDLDDEDNRKQLLRRIARHLGFDVSIKANKQCPYKAGVISY